MTQDANTSGEGWNGTERRQVETLSLRLQIILSGLTALAAIVALVVALVAFSDRLDSIQLSRQRSATDTCNLIVKLSLVAGAQQGKIAETEAFLKKNGLNDCVAYGREVTRTK